ncbi:MAG: hypothetical protein DI535_18360 [Citrobacter freundii]|nr:MAG: hypothetical protein DI535_18360 [Citrobacter freundii]
MNKFYLIILLSLGTSVKASAQFEGLQAFTHTYFRSDPFLGQFSAFINHLMKDEAIEGKQIKLKTDTSFFSFRGIFPKYNPFSFKPAKLEIALIETPIQYSDSLPVGDTLLIYQLTAYADATPEGLKAVEREFEKIHRKFAKRFFDSNYNQLQEEGQTVGGLHNYFVPMHGVAPVSVAWGVLGNSKQPALNITIRMKTEANYAQLPVPLYNP